MDSEMTSSDEQDQRILEVQSQVELLKEEQERKIDQVRESFLQGMAELKGQIQVLNAEEQEEKAAHEKALTEMKEKHAAQLKDQERIHQDRMSKVSEKHEELEQRLQAMQRNYKEKLCKQKEKYSHTIMEMKEAFDDRLQNLETEIEEICKNSKEKETIDDLRKRLKIQEHQLCTVRNMETLMLRMQADLQTCSKYVQYPQQLRDSFIRLQLHKPARFNMKTAVMKKDTRYKEHLQGTLDSQGQSQTLEDRNQEAECSNKLKATVEEVTSKAGDH